MSNDIFMGDEEIVGEIRKEYERLSEVLDERSRCVWTSAEAEALGYGGQSHRPIVLLPILKAWEAPRAFAEKE